MILNGVKLIGFEDVFNIRIHDIRIASVSKAPIAAIDDEMQIGFEHALAFPGLINSHDHLDFNLFPQFGYGTYTDYVEWGNYIHEQYKDEINRVLNIPVAARIQWGIYKNLIGGVTTVVDHGIPHTVDDKLITVFNRTQNLHSVQLEKNWRLKLNNPFKKKFPVVMHIGEGTGEAAGDEIDELIRWNVLRRNMVGVHGVAMNPEQARHFRAMVWCPETNYYLLNRTAPVNNLKGYTDILFGTDSTLTGSWNIWDHISLARKTSLLSDQDIYHSLTTTPAKVWKLNAGKIAPGKDADLVIAKAESNTDSLTTFFDTQPESILMVIHQGQIRLFDESLLSQLRDIDLTKFSKITVNKSYKYVQGNLPELMEKIKSFYPAVSFPVTAAQKQSIQ